MCIRDRPLTALAVSVAALLSLALLYRFIYLRRTRYHIGSEQLISRHGVLSRKLSLIHIYRTCGEGGKDFRAETPLCFRACLHVHFAENLGKKFHPVIVIHCKELVVVPLGYLMACLLYTSRGRDRP